MFREKYIRDNARIVPDETVSDRVLETVLQEEARRIPSIAPRRQKRKVWRRVIAVAACLAVVAGSGVLSLWLLAPSAPVKLPTATPLPPSSYGEVYELIRSIRKKSPTRGDAIITGTTDGAYDFSSDMLLTGTVDTAQSTTQTNTQYANVDESDMVKTDGRYLYVLDAEDNTISIVKAEGAITAVVSTLSPEEVLQTEEDESDWAEKSKWYIELKNMYYINERLVVLYEHNYYRSRYFAGEYATPTPRYTNTTGALVYDVSDRTAPQLVANVAQDGALTDSRVVGEVLYLVTHYSVYKEGSEVEIATYVPSLYRNGAATCVAESDLSVISDPDACNYTVITAVSLSGAVERLSQQAMFGSGSGMVYANTDHLLVAQTHCTSREEETALEDGWVQYDRYRDVSTALALFSLTDGQIAHIANATIEGELDGQFAMDEYKGYFRIAATRSSFHSYYKVLGDKNAPQKETMMQWGTKSDNVLYVLNSTLQEVGRVKDLAPDEEIKSVRFDGDIGYVVTFRETDPLFAIDLSDPTDPTVLSALKITGFSEYLHPYGKNRLLGFGIAATENGISTGLKLTMFDTGDKTDVTVLDSFELPKPFLSRSEALEDHHAMLVDTQRNLIGFPAVRVGGRLSYFLCSYNEKKGFAIETQIDMPYLDQYSDSLRGIWIADVFYLCSADGVYVYNDEYAQIAVIEL